MTENNKEEKEAKPDMRRYDFIGLAEQMIEQKENESYVLGAMSAHGKIIPEEELREVYEAQLRIRTKEAISGLELAISTYSKKRKEAREKTNLGDFCAAYSVDGFIKTSLGKHSNETIGEIEKKVANWQYITKDSGENFSDKQKEEAKKQIKAYIPILTKIKLVEDRVFAELKKVAIDRTKEIMAEEEKKSEEKEPEEEDEEMKAA